MDSISKTVICTIISSKTVAPQYIIGSLECWTIPMLFYYMFCEHILVRNEIETSELVASSYTIICR